MPRLFIADSDDSDDGGFSNPPSPRGDADAIVVPGGTTTARSSGHLSHATASTDLEFFQTVFDEQNDAALLGGDAVHHELSSSVGHGAIDLSRVATRLDTSLLTSVTDPIAEKGRRVSSGRDTNELTQVTTPGREKKGSEKDPWEFPSSAEAAKPSTRKLKPARKKSPTQTSPLTGSRTGEHHATEEITGRGTKRRKLDPSQQSELQNDVDLVTMPLSSDMDTVGRVPGALAPSSCLVPTLPPGTDSSLLVVPKSLTSSQKKEYQSVVVTSSDSTAPNARLLRGQQYGLVVGSSGSVTNINTPRSEYKSSHDVSLQSGLRNATQMEQVTAGSPQLRYSSSPDVISVVEPTARSTQVGKRKRKPKEGGSGKVAREEETAEWEDTAHQPQTRDDDLQANGEEEDEFIAPKEERQKKPRGRPKKKTGYDSAPGIANQPAAHTADEKASNTVKKKRGRPKKTVLEAEERPSSLGAGDDSIGNQEGGDGGQPDETRFTPGEAGEEQPSKATEESLQTGQQGSAAPATANGCGSGELAATDATVPVQDKAKAGNRTPLAAGSGRPLYRVGLSKRSRIAPLLKMVRK